MIQTDIKSLGPNDFMGASTSLYSPMMADQVPNSVQHQTTIRTFGNQSVNNAMQNQILSAKNSQGYGAKVVSPQNYL
jgi:hypothetical protein